MRARQEAAAKLFKKEEEARLQEEMGKQQRREAGARASAAQRQRACDLQPRGKRRPRLWCCRSLRCLR